MQEGEVRILSLYDGRELIGTISGVGKLWHAVDARGAQLPGAPFKSQRIAAAALNASRAHPCAADGRLDNS